MRQWVKGQRDPDGQARGRFQRVVAARQFNVCEVAESGVCRIGADCFKSEACLVNECLLLRGFALANQILESTCV